MSGWESNWNRMIWKIVIKMYLLLGLVVRCRRVGTMKQLRIFNVTLCDYSAPTDRRDLRCYCGPMHQHLRAYVIRTESCAHICIYMSIVMVYEIAFECYRLNRYIIRQLHKDMRLHYISGTI